MGNEMFTSCRFLLQEASNTRMKMYRNLMSVLFFNRFFVQVENVEKAELQMG
jgi:hypothetical protein